MTNRPVQKIGRKPRSRPVNLSAITAQSTTTSPEAPTVDATTRLFNNCDPIRGATEPHEHNVNTPDSMIALEADVTRTLADVDLSDDERSLLEACFAKPEAVGQFTIGKSFHRRHQKDLLTRLSKSSLQLKDGFMCCGAMFARGMGVTLPQPMIEMCERRAANAVSALRDLEITNRQDVSTCLVLGIVVTTFALYVAAGETASICRCVLAQLKPIYENGIELEEDETSFFMCLLFTDLYNCLLQNSIPTLQIDAHSSRGIDRYFGYSIPLFTFLHDICLLSSELWTALPSQIPACATKITTLQSLIRQWRPAISVNICDDLDQIELIHVLAQAKALRFAALLMVHRLKYPFGEQIEHGQCLSEAILIELELAKTVTKRIPEGLDLAVTVALIETEDGNDQSAALAKLDHYSQYSEATQHRLYLLLSAIWAARRAGRTIYWYNVHNYLPA
jgi:hypothetical protein